MRIELQNDLVTIYVGDSADLDLPANSVDAIVCDPPSGIAFMGKAWDRDKGGRDGWIAWLARTIAPAFAALKPGGHGLFWALPRTSHWTAMALELAGFEVRDRVTHLFGTGFPKSLDVSKAIDQRLGAARLVIGAHAIPGEQMQEMSAGGRPGNAWTGIRLGGPVTPEAAEWDGWGTALKPAAEDWWLVRKPLQGTVAANVLAHGTGALNIDASRIGTSDSLNGGAYSGSPRSADSPTPFVGRGIGAYEQPVGRWPAHVMFSHSEDCILVGTTTEIVDKFENTGQARETGVAYGETGRQVATSTAALAREVYRCAPGCAVAQLDEQSGTLKARGNVRQSFGGGGTGDTVVIGDRHLTSHHERPELKADGGASRFFYCPKPSKAETEAGLDDLPGKRKNTHPTKKSVALMRYLIRLITPPGGVVLDPFAGSGTTGIAALAEGMRFIGCEQGGDGEEYVPILIGRIMHAVSVKGVP